MDDKTNLTPEQDEVQTGEEVSFTISGEDAAAQEALNAKKTAKKKSPLPWIIGGAAVVVAAALVLILTLKPKTVSPDAEQPGDATISEPAGTPDGTDSTQPDDQTPAEDGQTGEQADGEQTEPAGNGVSYTVEADALTEDVLNREIAVCGDDHLTNRELPYYYWQQYYTLMNNYGSYASYFIDTSTPFDQQMCLFDDTLTWQQYFLQGAITNYENVTAIWLEARLAGFQLSQEDQDYLDDLDNQTAPWPPQATATAARMNISRWPMARQLRCRRITTLSSGRSRPRPICRCSSMRRPTPRTISANTMTTTPIPTPETALKNPM